MEAKFKKGQRISEDQRGNLESNMENTTHKSLKTIKSKNEQYKVPSAISSLESDSSTS